MSEVQLALGVFAVTYALIISERVHKTTAALAGGMTMVALNVLDTEQAFGAIDLEVIFLLTGMMIIANTMASTGVFQWMAIRSAKPAGGSPMGVLLLLCPTPAVTAAFLVAVLGQDIRPGREHIAPHVLDEDRDAVRFFVGSPGQVCVIQLFEREVAHFLQGDEAQPGRFEKRGIRVFGIHRRFRVVAC